MDEGTQDVIAFFNFTNFWLVNLNTRLSGA